MFSDRSKADKLEVSIDEPLRQRRTRQTTIKQSVTKPNTEIKQMYYNVYAKRVTLKAKEPMSGFKETKQAEPRFVTKSKVQKLASHKKQSENQRLNLRVNGVKLIPGSQTVLGNEASNKVAKSETSEDENNQEDVSWQNGETPHFIGISEIYYS